MTTGTLVTHGMNHAHLNLVLSLVTEWILKFHQEELIAKPIQCIRELKQLP